MEYDLAYQLLDETLLLLEEEEEKSRLNEKDYFLEQVSLYLPPEVLVFFSTAFLEEIWEDRFQVNAVNDAEEEIPWNSGFKKPRICEICEREGIPLTRHHLYPRDLHKMLMKRHGLTKEKLDTSLLTVCRMCHSTLHRTFTNEELALQYNTLEALFESERIVKYAQWASHQSSRNKVVR